MAPKLFSSLLRQQKRSATGSLLVLTLALSTSAPAIVNKALRARFDAAVSKWIARDSHGTYYLLNVGKTLAIRVVKGPSDKNAPIALPQGIALSAGMVVDSDDRLHLCWNTPSGFIGYNVVDLRDISDPRQLADRGRWLDPVSSKPGSLVLARTDARLGDITVEPNGTVWLAWTATRSDHQESVHMGTLRDKRWQAFRMAGGYGAAPPSLMVDRHRAFHLAWHDVYEDTYYLTGRLSDLGVTKDWQAKAFIKEARRPVMADAGDHTLAVFETNYSALEYLFANESRRSGNVLTGRDARFSWDTCYSPEFAIDRYGIPWMFFIDSARRHVFYSRWLGAQWSDISNSYSMIENSPRMEDNHAVIDRLSVEARMTATASGIGLAISHDGESTQQKFFVVPVPSLEASPGKKVLFLDLLELKSLDGVVLRLNQARKYEGNPVITTGGADDFDAERGGNYLRVLKENSVYRMWYAGLRTDPAKPWWEWYRIGYAESRDGRKFEKIKLGLAPFGDQKNTNLIPDLPYVPMIGYDPLDPNTGRRYKLLRTANHGIQNDEAKAGRLDPWREVIDGALFTSPDGIHWTSTPAEVQFPAGRPFSFIPQSLFHDQREKDPAKKYKTYGFSSLNLARRGGSYAYSADAIHWTAYGQNPVLDPFARDIPVVRGGKVHQIHDTVVWQYGDYYLAFYQYQLKGENQDVEVAVSRDGENFVFVRPGEKLIPLGQPGGWECDEVTASAPLVDDDEIKLYYGGGCGNNGSGGLATLRLDGFTDLELEKDRDAGTLATIPIKPAGATRLYVNADCGQFGYLQAELIDPATGHALRGFSRGDSIRITGDSTAQALRWNEHSDLTGITSGEFQLKIYLVGTGGFPKFYSFEFR